jgi:hypothetical protein
VVARLLIGLDETRVEVLEFMSLFEGAHLLFVGVETQGTFGPYFSVEVHGEKQHDLIALKVLLGAVEVFVVEEQGQEHA